MNEKSGFFNNLKFDVASGLVVFLVALPLCLGVALASKVDPFSGIIAGIVGGLIIGFLSKSPLSVSGPAAGLTAIVGDAIVNLPTVQSTVTVNGVAQVINTPVVGAFFLAVVLSGVFQLILGFIKAGVIGSYIPTNVIRGMLAAIGLILILKQIPHFLGRDTDPEGDETFVQVNGETTFTSIYEALKHPTLMAIVIGCIGVVILLLWETKFFKSKKIFSFLSGPLVVVIVGVLISKFFTTIPSDHLLENEHYVNLKKANNVNEFLSFFSLPAWSFITNFYVWKVAFTLALVASIETLLSIEAVDKLDPLKRSTPTNRELLAQGTGNIISGLLGGLPVTSVIVRSSANVNAGAKSKYSAIFHAIFLLISVALIPNVLNLIPKAALAAILIITGYKLAKPSIFIDLFKKGYSQIVPFVITVLAILATDLLKGVIVGIIVSFYYIIKNNYRKAVYTVSDNNVHLVKLANEVSFLNKLKIKNTLNNIPDGAEVIIDCANSTFLDYDVQQEIKDFCDIAKTKNIKIEFENNSNQNFIFLKN
jgi:MFS superfamily sulfate permease-like transporter